jgi:NitT/TauT family transport system substrate-binding protein
LIDTPEARELGIGDVNDKRLADSSAVIAESYGLARTPAASEIFSRAFLPPKSARVPVKLTN